MYNNVKKLLTLLSCQFLHLFILVCIKVHFSIHIGTLQVDDGISNMIALSNDGRVLNGHTRTSQQLISTQSPTIDMTTLLSSAQSSAIPVTTIVTSSPLLSAVTAAVKNEPEDLTGQRRDSTNNNNNNSSSSNNNPTDPNTGSLLNSTNDAINVYVFFISIRTG